MAKTVRRGAAQCDLGYSVLGSPRVDFLQKSSLSAQPGPRKRASSLGEIGGPADDRALFSRRLLRPVIEVQLTSLDGMHAVP